MSVAKKAVWCTSVLFTEIKAIKTHSCLSVVKKAIWHRNVLLTGSANLLFSTPHIYITTGSISIKFTYFMPSIYTTLHTTFEKE